ncbi:hypothetical protein GDO78_015052 [Eleutherodactylus coqui]|uniref:Uncharacterized protein n=1 Tax=Eleutherodactylus coqui TaxID=57060 RepID=A0A8J6C3L9_ELECQ|nr:hypothetical protein GDO78_015052 [Eleutherodactylus coqui]
MAKSASVGNIIQGGITFFISGGTSHRKIPPGTIYPPKDAAVFLLLTLKKNHNSYSLLHEGLFFATSFSQWYHSMYHMIYWKTFKDP